MEKDEESGEIEKGTERIGDKIRLTDTLERKGIRILYLGEGQRVRKENLIFLFLSSVSLEPKAALGDLIIVGFSYALDSLRHLPSYADCSLSCAVVVCL